MDDDIREALGRIYNRLTEIETTMKFGNYHERLRELEAELHIMRGRWSLMVFVIPGIISIIVTLIMKVFS
jgi:hypothetical protein